MPRPPPTMAPATPRSGPIASDDWGPSVSASAIVAGAASGYHVLRIEGYSRTKSSLPNSKYILSRPCCVAGRTWTIRYFPNGDCPKTADYISLFLVLKDPVADPVTAQFEFSFMDQVEKQTPSYIANSPVCKFVTDGTNSWGYDEFIKRENLEQSDRLQDDCFTVRCDILVAKELSTEDAVVPTAPFVVVPPADWPQHFRALLLSGKGADVMFLVGAFQSLLHFIYTDSLPETKGQDEATLAQHLLEAADRYDLQRLKLICEDRLCQHIDVSTAATTLALAEQHRCPGLKEACFEFLKSPKVLDKVMATDGFQHLTKSAPSALFELMFKLAER